MSDDWQWFWASEGTRDRILREEIGGLSISLSSAHAQTSRLSSQLAQLSGSIESRLNALSRAFDAYVELGDVREELTAYAEPAAVRRDVMAAVEAIAGGRSAASVDPRGLDYWLPYAMNAVSAYVEGRDATADLGRARDLAPETDLFVVAAVGALGHGATVADLLAGVLTADDSLTDHQVAVWRAVATGAYGSELPADLAATWRRQLDREPAGSWSGWVAVHAPSPSSGLAWLRAVVLEPEKLTSPTSERGRREVPLGSLPPSPSDTEPTVASTPADTAVGGLRTAATELIHRGMPAEAELLRRARELRVLIEQPNTARPTGDAHTPAPTVGTEVRRALLEPTTDPGVRAALRAWVAPALVRMVDELVASAAAAPPTQATLRGHGGLIVVTAAGADPDVLRAARERLTSAYQTSTTPLRVWAVGAGVAALLTLGLGIAGSGWAWLFAVGLVAGVIGTALQVARRRRTQQTGAAAIAALHQDVAETSARLGETEKQRTVLQVQLDGEAADLRTVLTGKAGASPQMTPQEEVSQA